MITYRYNEAEKQKSNIAFAIASANGMVSIHKQWISKLHSLNLSTATVYLSMFYFIQKFK